MISQIMYTIQLTKKGIKPHIEELRIFDDACIDLKIMMTNDISQIRSRNI